MFESFFSKNRSAARKISQQLNKKHIRIATRKREKRVHGAYTQLKFNRDKEWREKSALELLQV